MLTIFSISLAWCLNIYCDFLWSPTFNFLNGRALLYIDSDMMQIDIVSVLKEEQVQNVKMMIVTFKFYLLSYILMEVKIFVWEAKTKLSYY